MNLKLALPSFLVMFAAPAIKAADPIDPPNIDQVTYSVNALIGKPPSEQRGLLIGSKMFDFTKTVGRPVNGYNRFPELNEISNTENCKVNKEASENWWGTSSSSLESQSSTSRHGYEKDVDLSVTVPVKGAEVGAETAIRNALVFGNSHASNESFSQKESGMTHSINIMVKRNLYSVEVDYDDIAAFGAWTEDFKRACSSLGSNPTQTQLLEFFEEHGTHGLQTASFGQKCTSSVFMEGGQTSDAYQNFQSDQSSYEVGFWWFNSSGESIKEEEKQQASAHSFKISFSNRRCDGELKRDSTCGGGMKGTGKDAPAIVDWSFKPIWEMDVPGFTPQAKAAMKRTVEAAMVSAVKCANTSCNGRGSCAGYAAKWKYVSRVKSLDELFNPNKCFCVEGVEGDKCNQQPKPSDKLTTSGFTKFLNQYDESLEYNAQHNGKRAAISTMYSRHLNKHEDRQHRFKVTVPEGYTSFNEKSWGNHNAYDEESLVDCPRGWALTAIASSHHNDHEDRRWTYKCGQFGGWQVDQCDWTGLVNDYDKPFYFQCPYNKVIGGLKSVHHNQHEDRIFQFKCCKMTKAPLPPLASVRI